MFEEIEVPPSLHLRVIGFELAIQGGIEAGEKGASFEIDVDVQPFVLAVENDIVDVQGI